MHSLDVAVYAWSLETLISCWVAVEGLLQIITDYCYVIYTFASAPAEDIEHFYATLGERFAHGSRCWHLLAKDERHYHDDVYLSLVTVARGLSTIVGPRKCCMVVTAVPPCLEGWRSRYEQPRGMKGQPQWNSANKSSQSATFS